MKKVGLFVVIPASLFSVFLIRGEERLRFSVVCASAVLTFFVVQIVATSLFGIIPGNAREAYSMPLQQIARTLKFHDSEIDDDSIKQLSKVLQYEGLGDLYDPTVADPVKAVFDDEAFKQDPISFVSAYLRLGCRYPSDYLNAFLNGTLGYWYPNVKYWMAMSSDYVDILDNFASWGDPIYDDDYESYTKPALSSMRGRIMSLLSSLRSVPVLSCFFSIGFWVWIYCFLLVIALKNKSKSAYAIFVIAGMVWLTCLISPVYAEMRYAFALLLMLPLAFWSVLSQWHDQDRNPGASEQFA